MPDSAARRSALGAAAALLLGVAMLCVIAEIGLRILMPSWSEFDNSRFMEFTAIPGYGTMAIGKPGFEGVFAQNNGDFRIQIKLNEAGLREAEPVNAAAGRVWTLGDSMTFGWGVEQEHTFSTVLASLSGRATYNVASPGTEVCGYEALLARMLPTVKPSAVVLGLVLENDLTTYNCPRGKGPMDAIVHRNEDGVSLLSVKLFLTRHSALYNVLAVSLKRVSGVIAVLQSVGLVAVPQHYRQGMSAEELDSVIDSTADELAYLRTMISGDTPLAVLIVPARFEIRDGDPYFTSVRRKMLKALQQRGLPTIDPTEGFRSAGFAATHFVHDGHWSPLGHRIAATAIADWLAKVVPSDR